MVKFEYKIISIPKDRIPSFMPVAFIDDKELLSILTTLGNDGWEVVSALDPLKLLLKRVK